MKNENKKCLKRIDKLVRSGDAEDIEELKNIISEEFLKLNTIIFEGEEEYEETREEKDRREKIRLAEQIESLEREKERICQLKKDLDITKEKEDSEKQKSALDKTEKAIEQKLKKLNDQLNELDLNYIKTRKAAIERRDIICSWLCQVRESIEEKYRKWYEDDIDKKYLSLRAKFRVLFDAKLDSTNKINKIYRIFLKKQSKKIFRALNKMKLQERRYKHQRALYCNEINKSSLSIKEQQNCSQQLVKERLKLYYENEQLCKLLANFISPLEVSILNVEDNYEYLMTNSLSL